MLFQDIKVYNIAKEQGTSSRKKFNIFFEEGGKNMKLKKVAALLLASTMALSLTACGGGDSDSKGGS